VILVTVRSGHRASLAAGTGGIKAANCAACWPRQNAVASSGLVLRNPIRLFIILAIPGIACSGTSPASTPAAADLTGHHGRA
jgi:hypothetical protein